MAFQGDPAMVLNSAPQAAYMRGDSQGGDSTFLDLQKFFGSPLNQPAMDAFKMNPTTATNLWQAYRGNSFHLNAIVGENLVRNRTGFWTQQLLPLFRMEQLSWVLTKWVPNRSPAGRVPHEAPSRLLSSRVQRFKGETERFGISAKLEEDFYKSPGGQLDFLMKVGQIRDAAQLAVDIMVAECIDKCPEFLFDREITASIVKTNPNMLLDWQTRSFGFAHRQNPDAKYCTHVEELKNTMVTYGGMEPDTALVPSNCPYLLGGDYSKLVPTKYERIDSKTGEITLVEGQPAFGVTSGLMVFRVPLIRLDVEGPARDPLEHQAMLGQIHFMYPRQDRGEFKDYTTKSLTVGIHSETPDQYVAVPPVYAFDNCSRWDQRNGVIREEHYEMMNDLNSGSEAGRRWRERRASMDPFFRYNDITNEFAVVHNFGEMERHFLTPAVLSAVVTTLENKQTSLGTDAIKTSDALKNLVTLVKNSHSEPGTAAYMDTFAAINAKYAPQNALGPDDVSVTPLDLESTNAYIAFDIPDENADPKALEGLRDVPPFINTFGMARTLAELKSSPKWKKAAGICWEGCKAIESIAGVVETCFPLCELSQAGNLPTMQQRLLANASKHDVLCWALFNVLCGPAFPAFIKLRNFPPFPEEQMSPDSALVNTLTYGVATARLTAITDMFTSLDGSDLQMPAHIAESIGVIRSRLGNNSPAFVIASLAGMVQSVIKVARRLLDAAFKGQPITTNETMMNKVTRLVTRLFLDDLLLASQTNDDPMAGLRVPAAGWLSLVKQLTDNNPTLNEKYGKYMRLGATAATITGHIGSIISRIYEGIRGSSGATISAEIDVLFGPSLSDMPHAERIRGGMTGVINETHRLAFDRARVIAAIVTGDENTIPRHFGDGNWEDAAREPMPVIGGNNMAAATKFAEEIVKLARRRQLRPGMEMDGTVVDRIFLNRLLDYSHRRDTTAVAPAAMLNSTDRDAEEGARTPYERIFLIDYETDFTPALRNLFRQVVFEGIVTENTTLVDLWAWAKQEGLNDTDRARLPFYNAPFGCSIALAQKFASNVAFYGQTPLVFPADPSSDPPVVAVPGGVSGSIHLADVIRAEVNHTNTRATLELARRGEQAVGFTGILAIYRPAGVDVGDFGGSSSQADPHAMVATVAHMLEDYKVTYGPSEAKKLYAVAFAMTPMDNVVTYKTMLDNDIVLPFSMALARPFITASTEDVVIMKRGKDTGLTMIGHENVGQGFDAQHGVWLITYHFWASPTIYTKENVVKLNDAVINRIRCGFDTAAVLSDMDTPFSQRESDVKDIIFMLGGFYTMRPNASHDVNAGISRALPNPISINGKYDRMPVDLQFFPEYKDFFEPAVYYSYIFPRTFRQAGDEIPSSSRHTMTNARINVLCWRGETLFWNPSAKDFSGRDPNTGPFQENDTKPGTGMARRNHSPYAINPPDVTFGG